MERGQQKKRFYSETQGNAVCGGLMKILWNSPCVTVLWKLFLSRGVSLLVCEVGWLGQACILVVKVSLAIPIIADILEPSLQVVLVYSMLEKKNCRFWSEADAGYLLSGSNKVKLWRQQCRFLLSDCCGWAVILGAGLTTKQLGVQATGAGT